MALRLQSLTRGDIHFKEGPFKTDDFKSLLHWTLFFLTWNFFNFARLFKWKPIGLTSAIFPLVSLEQWIKRAVFLADSSESDPPTIYLSTMNVYTLTFNNFTLSNNVKKIAQNTNIQKNSLKKKSLLTSGDGVVGTAGEVTHQIYPTISLIIPEIFVKGH